MVNKAKVIARRGSRCRISSLNSSSTSTTRFRFCVVSAMALGRHARQQLRSPGRPLTAAVATGVIWGIWHSPLILRAYDFDGQTKLGAAVFLVWTVLLSVIFGWLRDQTGSVWTPSLAHAAANAV